MDFSEKLKKYRESQKSNYAAPKNNTPTTPTSSSKSEDDENKQESFREKLGRYWVKNGESSAKGWIEASIATVDDVYKRSGTWFNGAEYSSQANRVNALLAQADNWRKQYAGNQEAVDAIDEIVGYLGKAKDTSYRAYNLYRKYKSAEDFDAAVAANEEYFLRNDPEQREARQQRYEDNQKRIAEIEKNASEYSYYENQYMAIENGLSTDFKPENIPYAFGTTEYWQEYSRQEAAWNQQVINKYHEMQKHKDEYIKKAATTDIEALRADMLQYERGEGGYVDKTIDDYYNVTQNKDFSISSQKRDYVNPGKEELDKADIMNNSELWRWKDPETGAYLSYQDGGVYVDAFGNELAVNDDGEWYNPAADIQVADKLGLYLSASEDQVANAITGGDGNYEQGKWNTALREGYSGAWEDLDETEIGIYYTLYDTQGQEAAYKYLDDMSVELNRRRTIRQTEEWQKNYEEANLLEKILMNVSTVPASVFGGAIGFIDDAVHTLKGEEVNPYSSAHTGMHFTNTVRGETAADLNEWSGKLPFLEMGLGDIYQVGMSRLDSALATKAFGGAGTVILGMNAATNEAYRLYQQGATADQITLGAVASGTAEALFEYISFDKLVKMGKVGTKKEFIKQIMIQGGIEASEELATEVSNIISNAVIMGSQSDVQKMLDANGGDWTKTGLQLVQQATQAAIGGFIGGMGAGITQGGKSYIQTTSEYRKDGRPITQVDGGVDALKALADEVAGVSDAKMQKSLNKQAANVSAENATGKWIGGKAVAAIKNRSNATKVGRLYNTVQTANNLNNASANQSDIANSLYKQGFSAETANDIAAALVAEYNGQKLTKAQSKLLESARNSDVVRKIISDVMNNPQSTMGQRSQNIREFDNNIALGTIAKAYGVSVDTVKEMAGGKLTTEHKTLPESHYEVSVDGKTIDKEGNDIVITGVESIENGKLILKTENGTIDASDVSFATQDEALVYSAISDMDVSAETAWSLIQGFKATDGVSAQTYAVDIPFAYKYGKLNYKAGLENLDISADQKTMAFDRGRADAEAEVKAKAAAKATVTDGSSTTVNEKSADKKIIFEGFTYNKKTANTLQKASMVGIEMVNKMSSLEVHVYESFVKDGKRYAKVNGKLRLAPNGYFTDGNKIYIDINAGNKGEGMMLYTFGHEVGHYIAEWDAEDFKAISDFLFEHYGKDVPIDKLLEAQKQKLIKSYKTDGKAIPSDSVLEREAQEELVCDMLSRMFADKNAYDKLMELKQKDLKRFQKLGQAIKKLLDKLKKLIGVYNFQNPDFLYAASAENFGEEAFRQLQDLYMRAFVKADENYQTAEAQKNTTDEGGVKYEIREIGNTGKFYVQADRQVITGDDASLWGQQIEGYINEQIRKGQDLAIPTADGHVLLLTSRSAYKLKDNHISAIQKKLEAVLSDDAYALKGRVVTHIDELIQVARFNGYEPDVDQKHENDIGEDGFNYFDAFFRDFDGSYYLVPLTAALNEQEETAYSIGNPRKRSFPADTGSSSKQEALKNGRKASGGIIYTSEAKSQEVKTAIQLAYEKALDKKNDIAKAESAEAVDLEVDAKTESVAPKVLNSERTWTESDYVQERDKAAKEIASAIGVSVNKAKAYIDSVNSIAKMIAEDRVRLDYFSSPGRSSFVGNVEYGGSFDFSTLCKKRRLLTGTFTAIQQALPNTALTANEILDIRNRMKDAGLEVSCGLCYVEGSRANMGQFAKEFLNLYKKYYPNAWQPNMADVNTPEGIEWVRINHPECYEQYEYFWNHYGTLKEGDKNLFASQQKPKLYQLHTEYKGEILDKFKDYENVEEKNLNGGIRLQSFSDFEIVHLIDTMQIIMDMSRVGLAGQAYTKVPDFAWALGDTGLKINLSLIAKGVDANGKLIFDDVEGMRINDAMKLRDRYSKNVGTILVAFNDEQLLAAMADERVDFIIPFHRSQWKKSQYGAMGLPAKTKDYTYMQNEKFIKPQYHEYRGRMVKDKATNYMPNEYWDFSKSGKENAEAYLEMCARNNKRPKFYKLLKNNGDGSYSLKDDGSTDGYWKLLIDFKMYDNDGVGSPQTSVKPEFNMDEATRMLNDYSGGHSNFPVAQGVVDSFVQEYKDSHKGQKFSDRDSTYLDAANRGDKETAKKILDNYAIEQGFDTDEDGAPDLLFHGTDSFGFTKIDTSKSDDSTTFWATPNMGVAGSYYADSNYRIREIGREKVSRKGEKLAYNSSMEQAINAAKPFAAEMGQDLSSAKYVKEATVMKKAEKQMQKAVRAAKAVLNGNFSDDIKKIAQNVISASNKGTYGAWTTAINQDKWQQYSETTGVKFWELDLSDNFNPDKSDISKVTQVDPDVFKMMYHMGDVLDALGIDDYATIKGETIDKIGVIDSYNDIVAEKGIYGFYHKQSNPFVYDCMDSAWNKIAVPNEAKGYFSKDVVTTRQLAEWAFDNGYDAIRLDNVVDVGGYALKEARNPATVWAFKNPESQIKSADPITYDDNGNVIPLDERFNQKNNDIRYQDRTDDSVSNRSLLANALESVAQNDIERNKIQEYKEKISLINAEEQKLSDLKAQIKELSFAKGPRDTKNIRSLQFEANQTANRISTYDKQLLRLEASKPLQDVLTREKKKAYKRAEQKGKEALAAYREKATKTQREMLERYQESRKKAVESRERTAMRHKIQSVVGELNQLLLSNDKKRHVPDSLKKAVADALALVNMDTVGAEERAAKYAALIAKETDPDKIYAYTVTMENILRQGEKMGQRLKELRDAYAEIQNSDDPDIANAYDPVIAGSLQELAQSIGNTSLKNMTIEQLQDVYDMYRMVLTRVRDANKSLIDSIKETIANRASRVVGEVKRVGGEHKYRVAALDFVKKFGWNNMKPVYAFEHIGSVTLTDAFNQVRAGEDTWAVDVSEARRYYLEKSKKYGYDTWDFNKKYKFKSTSDIEFELTLEQILSLYAYSKRDQAHDHLRLGGFVFDSDIEVSAFTKDGTELKKFDPRKLLNHVVKYKVNTADAHQISPEILANITGTLTKEQMSFVDEMQEYLSAVMGAKGNEITMKMYGVKLFKEKFYFPLKSARQFMFEQNEVSGEVRIKNAGFTNKVVAKANNPVILNDFMDVWADHVNDMSMYHAFVLPLEDFNRIFNYNSPKQEGTPPVSVKGTVQNAYSPAAVDYVKQLITDLNGGAMADPRETTAKSLVAKFKKAKVFSSLSVVFQQPSSIGRAFALVNPKYFHPTKDGKSHNELWEELKQYAPVAVIKEMGYFDTNMGKSTQDFIKAKEYSGIKEKAKALFTDSGYRDEALSKLPALADEVTWCAIWNAVKRETQDIHKDLKPGSEEFLKAAGKRFTEVVTKTQVYDSVLARSANMRSKGGLMSMITSFMAEPTTTINMLADAILKGKRGYKGYAAKAFAGVMISVILNNALVSLVYGMRDDDEDETFLEKYMQAFTSGMIDDINPITYYPYLKDMWSLLQGYDVERSDMSLISDFADAAKGLVTEYASEDGDIADAWWSFAGSVANIGGIPMENIRRDVNGAINFVNTIIKDANGRETTWGSMGDAVGSAVKGSIPVWGWLPGDKKSDNLYDAIVSGDKAYADRLKNTYKTEDAYHSAVRKALRENDPRIREAAQAQINGDPSERVRIAKLIIADGFAQDDVVMAINAEINDMKPDEPNGEPKEKGIYKAEDFALEIANGDYISANAAMQDFIQTAIKNGKDEDEAKKSFISSAKSALGDLFVDGGISEDQVIEALKTYCPTEDGPMDDDAIYWLLRKWKYEIETGSSEDYGKYNDFYTAVQTGKDLKAVIKEYTDNGVDAKTLASQITSYFKPLYKEMSNYERAGIKGYLLNAYVLLGYSRSDKSKDIDKWLKD